MHAVSTPLPAADEPDKDPLTGTTLVLPATDPPLPPGRRLVLSGGVPVASRRVDDPTTAVGHRP